MKKNREKLDELLNFDSLKEAEKISGKSYKKDVDTGKLGLGLMWANSEIKNVLLDKLGDSKFSNDAESYLEIVQSIGFEIVLQESFQRDDIVDQFYILWNDEYSILMKFDTFTWGDDGSWAKAGKEVPPPSVSSSTIYYNWKPTDWEKSFHLTSSGGMRKDENDEKVWVGDNSGVEAIKHKVSGLVDNGTFLKKWIERPFLWLLNSADSDVEGYDYDAINEERIAKLPKHVRDAITPKEK